MGKNVWPHQFPCVTHPYWHPAQGERGGNIKRINIKHDNLAADVLSTYMKLMDNVLSFASQRYETVRLLLDMGADPNKFGTEFTGDLKKDLKKRFKLYNGKMEEVLEAMEVFMKLHGGIYVTSLHDGTG